MWVSRRTEIDNGVLNPVRPTQISSLTENGLFIKPKSFEENSGIFSNPGISLFITQGNSLT